MDEKLPHISSDLSPSPTPVHPRRATMAPRRTLRVFAATLLLFLLGLYSYARSVTVTSLTNDYLATRPHYLPELSQEWKDYYASDKGLVPLEAHIMSKCPDTRDALRQLILPAMQKIHDKVSFKLSYIGHPAANDGVDCKHGPSECLGNILELCARELYPDPKLSLGFVMCLTKDYRHIPERTLVEDCALEHALDFQALNECATRDDGAHGMGMLRDSVQRTLDANVTKSCTIRLNNEIYCIRDDGDWTDCPHGPGVNDLVIQVEKLYRNL